MPDSPSPSAIYARWNPVRRHIEAKVLRQLDVDWGLLSCSDLLRRQLRHLFDEDINVVILVTPKLHAAGCWQYDLTRHEGEV